MKKLPHRKLICPRAKNCNLRTLSEMGIELCLHAHPHSVDVSPFCFAEKYWCPKIYSESPKCVFVE